MAAETVERFDPEGSKIPGGEWRQRKQPGEPASDRRNGSTAEKHPSLRGKPAKGVEWKADRAEELAGRSRSSRLGTSTLEWGRQKLRHRCRRVKGRYE
jgi:hypothetical protein